MTKTVSVNDVSIQTVIALTRNGDEIIIEENGEPLAKITPIEKPNRNRAFWDSVEAKAIL